MGEGITDEDYQHARTVWKEFNIESIKDYHNLYNMSDVLLLADVFENFRNICMNHYGMDPAWYFSASGLARDAPLEIRKRRNGNNITPPCQSQQRIYWN